MLVHWTSTIRPYLVKNKNHGPHRLHELGVSVTTICPGHLGCRGHGPKKVSPESSLGTKSPWFTIKWLICGWFGLIWWIWFQSFCLSRFLSHFSSFLGTPGPGLISWHLWGCARPLRFSHVHVAGANPRYIATGHSENAAKGEGVKYPEGHTSASPFRWPVVI